MIVAVLFVGVFALTANTTKAADCTISATLLKYGMKGADVTCLQTKLGLATPTGFFGTKTKGLVVAFQKANTLTADGIAGKKTLEAIMGTPAVVEGTFPAGCTSAVGFSSTTGLSCSAVSTFPAGCTSATGFSATTGAKCDGTTTVTTTAAEGSFTLQSAPVAVSSSVAQSEVKDNVWAVAVKAKYSDMTVNRLTVDMYSSASALPWKYFTNLYLYQDGTLLATVPVVDASNLTEVTFGHEYTVDFASLNVKIAKDATANFILKADIVGTVPATPASYVIGLGDGTNGSTVGGNMVRGVDGLNLVQYVNATNSYNRTVNFNGTSTGKLTVVPDTNNPIAANVVTSSTNVTTGITGLVFDLQNTSKYDVNVKSITATLGNANTNVSAYYLYDGTTMLASLGAPTGTSLVFGSTTLPSNYTVAANSTKVLTIKYDVNSSATPGNQTVSVVAGTDVTAIDTNSNLLTVTGSATGLQQTFQSTGVVVNLVSAVASATPSTQGVTGYTTGKFVFKVKANGLNLAKLSTTNYIASTVTMNGLATGVTSSYSVSPDTSVSDGSEVTVTLTAAKTTASAGFVKYAITSLAFEKADLSGLTTAITTGLDNFFTDPIYAN